MKKKIARDLGRRLREVRLDLGVSQRELARRLGIANSFVSDMEAGRMGPGFYFLFLAGKYAKINPVYLLYGKGPKFIDLENREKKQPVVPKEPQLQLDEFGDDAPRVGKMLSFIKRSEVVKFAVLGFFSKFIVENKSVIDADIKPDEKKRS
jgi:transcriptional regulator with XRE-family HTH domain